VRKLLLASAFLLAGAVGALAQTLVSQVPLVGTVQGRVNFSANTSTTIVAANVTMAPHSVPLPVGNLGTLNFVNESTQYPVYLCIGGGTATASAGCTYIGPGATIQVTFPNPGANQTAPTVFSTTGTGPLDFWN
jgi:hypothetical protein